MTYPWLTGDNNYPKNLSDGKLTFLHRALSLAIYRYGEKFKRQRSPTFSQEFIIAQPIQDAINVFFSSVQTSGRYQSCKKTYLHGWFEKQIPAIMFCFAKPNNDGWFAWQIPAILNFLAVPNYSCFAKHIQSIMFCFEIPDLQLISETAKASRKLQRSLNLVAGTIQVFFLNFACVSR